MFLSKWLQLRWFMAEQKNLEGPTYEKLCGMIFAPGGIDLKMLRVLVKDPKYICRECGRAAANEGNLCYPEKI